MNSAPKPPLKIAIIRLSAMGDIIHSASVLPKLISSLKKTHSPSIHWFIDERFQEILMDSPCIHKLIPLPIKQAMQTKNLKTFLEIFKTLRKESFDIVLDMQGLLKSALIAYFLPTKMRVGFAQPREFLSTLFYHKKIPIAYQKHILLRNATLTFQAFNLEVPNLESLKEPKDFLGFKKQDFPFLSTQQTKILCLLETSKADKTYPLELFVELALLFNSQKIIPFFLSQTNITIPNPNNAKFQAIYGLNLSAIKNLVAQMDLVIGGDTGITHLAWAVHRPSITLFGATPPRRFNLSTQQNKFLNTGNIKEIPPLEIFKLANTLINRN